MLSILTLRVAAILIRLLTLRGSRTTPKTSTTTMTPPMITTPIEFANPTDQVDYVQYLLDTDLINDHPEFQKVADYYLMEGLCYQVFVGDDYSNSQ